MSLLSKSDITWLIQSFKEISDSTTKLTYTWLNITSKNDFEIYNCS